MLYMVMENSTEGSMPSFSVVQGHCFACSGAFSMTMLLGGNGLRVTCLYFLYSKWELEVQWRCDAQKIKLGDAARSGGSFQGCKRLIGLYVVYHRIVWQEVSSTSVVKELHGLAIKPFLWKHVSFLIKHLLSELAMRIDRLWAVCTYTLASLSILHSPNCECHFANK